MNFTENELGAGSQMSEKERDIADMFWYKMM